MAQFWSTAGKGHKPPVNITKTLFGALSSAGVGRTGTLIALDIALEQIKAEGAVDISDIINKMREQRMKMVQTPVSYLYTRWYWDMHAVLFITATIGQAQFIFLHDIVLEHALCGCTLIPVPQLSRVIRELDITDPETKKTGFHNQYQVRT